MKPKFCKTKKPCLLCIFLKEGKCEAPRGPSLCLVKNHAN